MQAQRSVCYNALYFSTRVRFGTKPNEVFFKCLFREKQNKSKNETEKKIFLEKQKDFMYESLSTKKHFVAPLYDIYLLKYLSIPIAHLVHNPCGTRTIQENFYPCKNGICAGYLSSGNCPELLSNYKLETDMSSPKNLIHSLNKYLLKKYYEPRTRLRIVNKQT